MGFGGAPRPGRGPPARGNASWVKPRSPRGPGLPVGRPVSHGGGPGPPPVLPLAGPSSRTPRGWSGLRPPGPDHRGQAAAMPGRAAQTTTRAVPAPERDAARKSEPGVADLRDASGTKAPGPVALGPRAQPARVGIADKLLLRRVELSFGRSGGFCRRSRPTSRRPATRLPSSPARTGFGSTPCGRWDRRAEQSSIRTNGPAPVKGAANRSPWFATGWLGAAGTRPRSGGQPETDDIAPLSA
jgi:hypothetical protein